MLKNEIKQNALFDELKPIADGLNLTLVDVHKNILNHGEIQVCIVILNNDNETSIDDCEKLHRAVLPRLELLIDRENLSMEVSTPGLQRNIRDVYEFSVFVGRQCRVYSDYYSSWVEGVIKSSDDSSVCLQDYLIVDKNEAGKEISIAFSSISKAKLDYKFENKNNRR